MTVGQELWEAMCRRHPDAVCLGGVCYVQLDGGTLAKAEFTSDSGYYDGLRLTVLNPRSGPVDSLTLHSWNLPHNTGKPDSGCGENETWGICRPTLDIEALTDMAEEYLCLFREPDPETR